MLHREDGARFLSDVTLGIKGEEFNLGFIRVLVVPNFFHLRMMEASVFLGTFNAAEMFWYPSPDL